MPLTHPIFTVSVPKPDGTEHRAYDATVPGIAAIVGAALLEQLGGAVSGQTLTFNVTVFDMVDPEPVP